MNEVNSWNGSVILVGVDTSSPEVDLRLKLVGLVEVQWLLGAVEH